MTCNHRVRSADLPFQGWQALCQEDPQSAARELRRRIETLPRALRRAVFAWLPRGREWAHLFADTTGPGPGPLHGVPCMVKDLFDVRGTRTLAGSRLLEAFHENAGSDAALVRDLRTAGVVIAGKTQLNEFAYGLTGENPHHGDCPHPVFPDRLAGGSSSGSAYVVGAGIVPLAIGTDTAGSIRAPAAFCGIYAVRLADERWCREGCFPLAPSFDTVGWFTATPGDLARATRALVAMDKAPPQDPPRVVFGGHLGERLQPELAHAVDVCVDDMGLQRDTEVEAFLTQRFQGADTAYNVLGSTEAFQVHEKWLDDYRDRYDPVVWQRIDRGRHWSEAEQSEARRVHDRVRAAFNQVFTHWDALVLPALPAPSPTKNESTEAFRNGLLRLLCPGSLARLPAVSLPVFRADGLSGGLQVIFPDRPRCLAFIEWLAAFRSESPLP